MRTIPRILHVARAAPSNSSGKNCKGIFTRKNFLASGAALAVGAAFGEDGTAGNMLAGSDEETITGWGDGGYKFYKLSLAQGSEDASTIGFYWGADNGGAFMNGAHKAYLVVPTEYANAKGCSFNGIVTDIRNISAEAVNGEIYTIGGVRVKADKLQKGIYIVNGKKMVVK